MNEIKLFTYDFSKDGFESIKANKYGLNWPVVYIINNDKEAYIGESSSALKRMKRHFAMPTRREKYNTFNMISSETFNKSAIQDIESLLIQYMSADHKYKLENIQAGQNRNHNYYQKKYYIDKFDEVWKILKRKHLVNKDLNTIKNSDLFKYSPYKELTYEQYETSYAIFNTLLHQYERNNTSTFIVNGGAGTGKTILAIYLIKTITDIMNNNYNMQDLEQLYEDEIYEEGYLDALLKLKNEKEFKVAFVVPMQSFRKTLKKVFSSIEGLKSSIVIGPSEAVKGKYDLLIVDEAHRLRRKVNLTSGLYHTFNVNNKILNLPEDATELDWILKCSKYQILFYDKSQSIKPSDVRRKDFEKISEYRTVNEFILSNQLRVKGGKDYINYVNEILSGKATSGKRNLFDYDFKLFENINDMVDIIKEKNKEFKLCRVVAGYSWKWITKGKSYEKCSKENLYDISIEGTHFIWNTTEKDWVNSKNAIHEIGCIHTIQGYDLNYAGVIFGEEISYDKENKRIVINKENYHDINGKKCIESEEELENYILNIYKVLMTRGILGTYVYVCDKELREYFKKFM